VIGSIHIACAALHHNARTLCALLGSQTNAAFVVKSNGYGHGIVETARAIEPLAAKLCVFALEEAIALRDGGITAPIVVLGPVEPRTLDDALAANVELALWDTDAFVRQIAQAAQRRSTRAHVHVKINTGLNRFGLDHHVVAGAIDMYLRIGELKITGIFSHLASAEELDSPATHHQLARFNEAYVAAAPFFTRAQITPSRHIAASAAAMLWPQTRLDLARIGIALYGLWPSHQTREAMNGQQVDLVPALTYMSSLVVTRALDAGEAVGYGNTFHAPRAMRIGVVPLGYADGIPRLLSNRGAFLVDGARAPIVGRVAMNTTILDLTHAPNAHVGSSVTLIGTDGNSSVTTDDWATWADTINYEIVTRLPTHIPRIYAATNGAIA